jgi:putative ABC transport system permease protein
VCSSDLLEIIKNMFRRKTRTFLTITGITIGIFAFTVMGSMAEKIGQLVNGGTRYYADKVTVIEKNASMTSLPTPMNIAKSKEIAAVPGVAAVSGTIYTSLADEMGAVSMGPPASINATELNATGYESFKITFSSGRDLQEGDEGKVVVGADLVKKLDAQVGGTVTLRGEPYEVVGIMNKTLTAPDNSVSVSIPDAQKILYKSLPEIIQQQVKPQEIVNGFTVYINPGVDPDKLAETINAKVDGIKATGPKAFQDQVASATGILNAILFGVALISLLVGGLSIINTMTMSISERIREIGIKKAIGAKTHDIMREYLVEAGLIGLFGGLLGWGLGAVTVLLINAAMQNSGNVIFLLTPRISIFAILFSVTLGVLAGIYPAYYAVKVNIVKALREG